jgi:hypothetical protein
MSQLTTPPKKASPLKRYGPLIAIVVVVAVIAGVVVIGKSSKSTPPAKSTSSTSTSTKSSSGSPAGVLSFSQAKAEGKAGSIKWGSRCNVPTGTLKYPSFFAGACYAPFTGNNGGSTAIGVDSSTIKVVFYSPEPNDPILNYIESAIKDTATNAQTNETMQNWVQFYNHFYETYGRKVQLIPFTASGESDDPVSARADAVTIATDIKPFAVWGGPILTTAFSDELAARGVLCIDCGSGDTNSYFQQRAPYVWSLGMLPQQSIVHVTQWLKNQVSGRDASFAGEADFKKETRKFGMIDLVSSADAANLLTDWQKSFKAAGINVVQYATYASPLDLQTQAPALIAKLKAAGVTSVIFSGDPIAPQALTRAATAQDYFPEWIITGAALTDTAAFGRTYDQKQWAHAFGVSFGAARTGVTGAIPLYEWYFGKPPPDFTGAAVDVIDDALFYAVIQEVGPDLTAANFQKALFAAPPTPRAITQPSLSWGNHGIWAGTDYGGTDDATEIWWNPTLSGPDELNRVGAGMYEYVDGGKRYLPGQWPKEATQAFNPKGAVAIYTKVPPSEQVPNYPSPAASNG